MSIHLITFATEDYSISAERLKATALRFGVDEFNVFGPKDIGLGFQPVLDKLLPDSRGYGWWSWKSYFIFLTSHLMKDGDILIYCDAGNEIVDNVNHIISKMDDDFFLFSNGWQHSHWCKAEVAFAINRPIMQEGSEYFNHKQVQASSIFFRVSQKTKDFIQEWYAWSIMPGFVDNTVRGPQFPEFREHRHDQALLCCLQIKYGIKLHWFPSTMAMHIQKEHPGDNYPAIFNHHRKRNQDW